MGYMHKTSVRALLATGNEVGCSCPVVKKNKKLLPYLGSRVSKG
jgi:hypothetical protein